MDQSEQLQRQLAALDDTRANETRQVAKLQEEMRKALGQIKVMEQQVFLQLHLPMLFMHFIALYCIALLYIFV